MTDEQHIKEAISLCNRANRFSKKMSSMMASLKDVTDKKAAGWVKRIAKIEERFEEQELSAYKTAVQRLNVLKISLPPEERVKIEEIEARLKDAEKTLERELGTKSREFITHVKKEDWSSAQSDIEDIRQALKEANEDFTTIVYYLNNRGSLLRRGPSFGVDEEYSHASPHRSRMYLEKDIVAQRTYATCFAEFNIIERSLLEIRKLDDYQFAVQIIDQMLDEVNKLRATLQNRGYIYPVFTKGLAANLTHTLGFDIRSRRSLGTKQEDKLLNSIYEALLNLGRLGNILRMRRDNPDKKDPHWKELDYLGLHTL